MKTLTTLLPLLVITAVAAHAQLVNYNAYSTMTGPAVLGTGSSDQWNQFSPFITGTVISNAVDSTGATDAFGNGTVSITVGNFLYGSYASSGDGPLDGPASGPLAPNLFTYYSLGVGYAAGSATAAAKTITYTGLADNSVYTLDLYTRNQPNDDGREFTVTAPGTLGSFSDTLIDEESTTFTSALDTSATDVATYLGTTVYTGNYIQLIVKSDGSGDLTLDLNSGSAANGFSGGGEFDVTGAQIQAGVVTIPEPGTISMMAAGLGILVLLLNRRRLKLS